MTLWQGTIVEELRSDLRTHPATALAYAIGNVELRVFLLFGCEPDSPGVPEEARRVAAKLLDALMCGGDLDQVSRDCSEEIAMWREGRKLQ